MHARAYPISIDLEMFAELAAGEAVRALQEQLRETFLADGGRLVLRVDRTDPSKNIVRGFQAFGAMLDDHPELVGRVTFLAMLQPSRQDVPEYADYVAGIGAAVAEVNARHGSSERQAIDLRMADDMAFAVAAYSLCDVLVVNAVNDGMNLVAKEMVVVNSRDGVLALSENTGAHEELGRLRGDAAPVRRGPAGRRPARGPDPGPQDAAPLRTWPRRAERGAQQRRRPAGWTSQLADLADLAQGRRSSAPRGPGRLLGSERHGPVRRARARSPATCSGPRASRCTARQVLDALDAEAGRGRRALAPTTVLTCSPGSSARAWCAGPGTGASHPYAPTAEPGRAHRRADGGAPRRRRRPRRPCSPASSVRSAPTDAGRPAGAPSTSAPR